MGAFRSLVAPLDIFQPLQQLWQGAREFVPAMQDIYRAASQRAVELLLAAEPPVKAASESDSAIETD